MVIIFLPALLIDFLNDDISMISFTFDGWRPNLANLFNDRAVMGLYYRPLIDLTFAIDHTIWGWNSLGFRLTNVLLHLAATFLVYRLGRHLTTKEGAIAGALLFALHPIHEMSILWIVGRTDVACTLFLLGTLLAAIGWWEKSRSLWLPLALYLLALLSKEMALSLPLLLPPTLWWLDRINERRRPLRDYLMAGVPFAAVALLVAIGRYIFLGNNLLSSDQGLHGGAGPLQIVRNIAVYIGLLVVPAGHREIELLLSAYPALFMAGAVAVLLAAGFLLWRYRQTAAPLLFFALWVLITLLPVSRLMMRWYLYLPSVGFCLGLGWLLTRSRTAMSAGAILAAVYAMVMVMTELQWIEASGIATRMLDEVAADVGPVAPGDTIAFLAIPAKLRTTPVYNLGLPQALRMRLGVDSLECLVWSRVVMESFPARVRLDGHDITALDGSYLTINDSELMARRKGAETGMSTTIAGAELTIRSLDENNKITGLSIIPRVSPRRIFFFDGMHFSLSDSATSASLR